MIFKKVLVSDNYSKKLRRPDFFTFLHRIVCTLSALLVAYCLFMCILSFGNGLQDMRKLGGLGSSYPLYYYLRKYFFLEHIVLFLWMTAELILYVLQYRCAEHKKSFVKSVGYFSVMLMIHVVIWIYANSLQLPEGPPFSTVEEAKLRYCFFINRTTLPSVAYFILYLFRVQRIKSEKEL